MVQGKAITHGSAKVVLATLVAEGGDPAAIVEREGLGQADSRGAGGVVAAAIEANPDAVEEIRGGNRRRSGRSSAP